MKLPTRNLSTFDPGEWSKMVGCLERLQPIRSPFSLTSETTNGTSIRPLQRSNGSAASSSPSKDTQEAVMRLRWRGEWNADTQLSNAPIFYASGDIVAVTINLRLGTETKSPDPVTGLTGGANYYSETPKIGTWVLIQDLPYSPDPLFGTRNTAPGNDGGVYWNRISIPPDLFAENGQDTYQAYLKLAVGFYDPTRGPNIGRAELTSGALEFKAQYSAAEDGEPSTVDNTVTSAFGPNINILQTDANGNRLNLTGDGIPAGFEIAMRLVTFKDELGQTKQRRFLCTKEFGAAGWSQTST